MLNKNCISNPVKTETNNNQQQNEFSTQQD